MTALKEELANSQVNSTKLSSSGSNQNLTKEQLIQYQKDRTLFCINIDQNCTEDILYELFLQVGPIENIVRKTDRNGSIICLITYKHIESCDYAVKLFNGINLFNQSLKVQNSQMSSRSSSTNLNSSQSTPVFNPPPRSRQSIENLNQNIQPLMVQQAMQQNLMQLMSPLLAAQQSQTANYNLSFSNSNLSEDQDYRTNRNRRPHERNESHNRGSSQPYHQHRRDDRDRRFNRSRSRSPLNKRRR